jgi:hypothetical protein
VSGTAPSDQFGRKWSLIIAVGATGIDLSNLHLRFELKQSDTQTPNTAYARVYNLSQNTLNRIYSLSAQSQGYAVTAKGAEYARLIIQAGYQPPGNFGVIFDGTIKQLKRGRERNVDSYLEVLASDVDLPYNFGLISQTLAGGVTPQQQLGAIVKGQNQYADDPVALGDLSGMTGGVLPRGKVLWGMGRDEYWNLGQTTGTKLFIINGTLQAMPLTGYLPGQAVVLNSKTGMIGTPEATQNGIEITCLLNPKLRIGTLVQINNADINQSTVLNRGVGGVLNDISLFASTTNDGFYRIAAIDYEGDTRGEPWYCQLTCLSVDVSAPAGSAVLPYG